MFFKKEQALKGKIFSFSSSFHHAKSGVKDWQIQPEEEMLVMQFLCACDITVSMTE